AVEVYEKLIALSPDDVALKRNYAFFLARNQRLEDAKTVFEDLVNLDPSNDQSVIDLARLLTATDGSEAAERFLSEVTENDPTRYALRRYVAELRASARDIDGALEVLDGIAKSAGDTAEGLDARGRQAELFAATGRREEAETVIAEVLEKDPRQSKAMVVKSLLALEDEEVDDAIGFLRTILRDVPDSVPALSLLGRAHQMAGSDDLANDRYAQAFRASNAAPEIGLNYAQFLVGKQRLDAAEDVLGAVISRSPQNLQAWRAVAQVRLLRSDWVGAQAAAERIRRLGDDEVIVNQISGAALGGMNKLNESLDAFKKAHEAAPASARPLVALIRAYVAADRTPEAVSFLESLLQNNKANALASLLLAQTYGLTDQAEKIEPTLFAARENNPQTVAVHQSMYQYYISRNDTVKADETLDFAEGVLPDNLQVKLLRAGYYEQIENFEGAIAQYEAIYEKQPEAVVVTNNLASLLAEHRDDQESLQRARELAEQFRNSEIPHFRDTLAWAHFRLGEADEAVTIMKGVVDQLPNLAIFRYHLGRGYLEQGSTEAAKTELEEALKLVNGQSGINEQRIRSALEGI
ncbi:MAG: tetratricopeptide repeat protein, partial [Pseudomonadota bacterium]